MGAIKGSISFNRFFVWGEAEYPSRDAMVEAVQNNAFRPLNPQEDDEQHVGWCSIENPFDVELDHNKIFAEPFINLAMRLDRWVIPAPTLKAHLFKAEQEFLAEHNREHLSKSAREEIRKVVVQKLRGRMIPSMKVVDMSWDTQNGIVRLWNNSPKIHDLFEDLFRKTFGFKLVSENPYTTALRIGLSDNQAQLFEQLEPALFHLDNLGDGPLTSQVN